VRASEHLDRVALYVDGRPVSRDRSAPYDLEWDTTQEHEGLHSLLVYARGDHGHRAVLRLPMIVANASTFPPALAGFGLTAPDG
jgi:hypothetical protein